MKYIRTKDGRILLGTPNDNDLTGMVLDYQNGEVIKIPIIAQADTIQELCDEFVFPKHKIIVTYFDLKHRYTKEDLEDEVIFGAIWTDKGLIYVAKMNKKGELELL